jgi:sugar lactone lactonase YvrE
MPSSAPDRAFGNLTRVSRFAAAAAALTIPALAGCGGSGDVCSVGSGDGTLMVVVTGHDHASVTIDGVDSTLTASGSVVATAGPHAVHAHPVTSPQSGITSQVFAATVDQSTACVRAGATTFVNVTYALVPTSGKLWAGVSNAPANATMLGFTPSSVAATGTASAAIVANTGGSDGFTFDRDGNMWVLGGTTADAPVARYPASAFANNGEKIPDITIESPSFGNGLPGPKVLAFDWLGNLWVSVVAEGKIVKFSAAQIAAGGSPTAVVERTGIASPQGLAFDPSGNLWIAEQDGPTVDRIDADHLTASGSGADLVITAMHTASNVTSTLSSPMGLAFDTGGNLWVNYDGTLALIPAGEQTGTGTKTITPPVVITTDVLTLPVGMAFDQDNGLWLAHAVNKFARFDGTQLSASGSVTPSIVITSDDVGSAGWFAIYPAPPSTPLYHQVP